MTCDCILGQLLGLGNRNKERDELAHVLEGFRSVFAYSIL